jgi:A/G-specific adenine glycosylase
MTLAATRKARKPEAGRKARHVQESTSQPAKPVPAAETLLAWYDRHRRKLPWRAEPGESADPYRVWLSEIMLQQTTVKTVGPYFERFLMRWPDVGSLAAASLDDVLRTWAGLGYYARARNLHACAQAVARDHDGRFPDTEGALRTLPGIGAYTAAAIAAIAFGARATPVDGNIERVIARLFAVEEQLPAGKARIHALAQSLTPHRAGDFAQAMMDLGATICTPKRPACALCPLNAACEAHRRQMPESFPRKAAKAAGRLRRGAVFWVVREDGCALVRTRPPRGLLGGMTELPTTAWAHDFAEANALDEAPLLAVSAGRKPSPLGWHRVPGVVTHVFTHFPLELVVYTAVAAPTAPPPEGTRWVALARLGEEALPTVMRKVVAHATAAQRSDALPSDPKPRRPVAVQKGL